MSDTSISVTKDNGLSPRLTGFLHSSIIRLIGKRLISAVPVLFGVTLLTFSVISLLPGNTALSLLGSEATTEQIARLEAELNLDQPAWVRYLKWLGGVLTGDMGNSLVNEQPVTRIIGERFPVTLELVLYVIVLSVVFAVPLALLAARKPNGLIDRFIMLLSMTGLSIANYIFALLLVLIFAVNLGIFPSIGYTPFSENIYQNIRSLTLPAIAIAFPTFGFYTRVLRGDLLEQMYGEDYIVTAIAKGISSWRVLINHALRNSLFGLLTIIGLNFSALISGTVIIEQIFAIPGIGQLLLQSIYTRDIIVIQSIVLLLAVLTITANLVVDILYAVLDPRIRYSTH